MPIAAITGAAGFIGERFTAALRDRGYEVRRIDLRGADVVAGDITVRGDWERAFDGADLVVHTAAVTDENAPVEEHWRVNVGGTRTVLEAAADHGVGRVLHLSSKVVLGRDFPDGADESAALRMTGSPYTDTKASSEHQALRVAATGAVPVTIVRPGDVYGPGGTQWVVRPVELLRAGIFFLPASGRGILTPVYVDDLVAGSIAAAEHPAAAGRILHVNGGRGVTAAEYFGHLADLAGTNLRTVPVPAGVARGALEGVAAAMRAVGRPVPFSGVTVEYVTHPGTYSIAAVRELTGWEPAVDLDEGMRRTGAWLRERGLV